MLKKEFQNKDGDQKDLITLKTQSDHKPKTRRSKAVGRSGSDDYNNNSCSNMEESSFTPNQSSHSKLPSIGSSLRKGFQSILSPKSTHSAGSSLRKNFRSILSPKRSHSAGRPRVRKQCDFDGDESISGRQQDDDYGEFADEDDNYVDQDKFMLILCKELEITCDDDDE